MRLRDPAAAFPPQVIVMDEAHHASIQAEQLLVYLRDLGQRSRQRTDPFIVITSATIDLARFCSFFGVKDTVSVKGFTFPKQVIYPETEIADVEGFVANTVKRIVDTSDTDDSILIFCPTAAVIKDLTKHLQARLDGTPPPAQKTAKPNKPTTKQTDAEADRRESKFRSMVLDLPADLLYDISLTDRLHGDPLDFVFGGAGMLVPDRPFMRTYCYESRNRIAQKQTPGGSQTVVGGSQTVVGGSQTVVGGGG